MLNYFDSGSLWLILQEILHKDLNNDIVCLHVLSQIFQFYYSKDFFNWIHFNSNLAERWWTNEEEVEIQKTIMSKKNIYSSLLPIIKSQLMQREDKLRIYRTSIQPVLSCGCKAWTLTQDIRIKPSNMWKKNSGNL